MRDISTETCPDDKRSIPNGNPEKLNLRNRKDFKKSRRPGALISQIDVTHDLYFTCFQDPIFGLGCY